MIPRFRTLILLSGAMLCAAMIVGDAVAGDMSVEQDETTGAVVIREGEALVLQYNYKTVQPPEGTLETIAAGNQKYARPRSNYIHPLYGPTGEKLTKDWSKDHPHHRGIYWAWPEVMYKEELGDLHALQRVFARPTGEIELKETDDTASLVAQSVWKWEDKTPIVHETTTILAHKAGDHGRYVDLTFEMKALVEGVSLARRGTRNYGGLNIRLAPITGMKLANHADPAESQPRQAWQYVAGTWQGAAQPAVLAVLEDSTNPDYPGDYIQYPNLPWFQPTFPRAGTRYALSTEKPLTLRYRLLIADGDAPDVDSLRRQWSVLNDSATADTPSN